MGKFCSNCGSEVNEIQDICLNCGVMLEKYNEGNKTKDNGNHRKYKTTTGVIMIILGACMVLGASDELYDYPVLVYSIPGLLGFVSGILTLNSKNNVNLLLISGILLFIGAFINFLGIMDVSVYMIFAIIFGIFNVIYSKEK